MRSMISSAVSSVQIVGSSLADDHKLFRPTRDPTGKKKKKKFRCCCDCFVVNGCFTAWSCALSCCVCACVCVVSGSAVLCVSVGWTLAHPCSLWSWCGGLGPPRRCCRCPAGCPSGRPSCSRARRRPRRSPDPEPQGPPSPSRQTSLPEDTREQRDGGERERETSSGAFIKVNTTVRTLHRHSSSANLKCNLTPSTLETKTAG